MRISAALSSLLILLVLAVPGLVAPTSARAAVAARRHVHHRPTLATLAHRGDPDAQYKLGLALLAEKSRRYAARRRQDATVWLMLAGARGNADAARRAATLLEQRGLVSESARWWYLAGTLGDAGARARFVDLYLAGKAPSLLGPDGAAWLAARATADGSADTALALARAYDRGTGIPADIALARHWYRQAIYDGSLPAMVRLGRMQLTRPAQWRLPEPADTKGKLIRPTYKPLILDARDRDGTDDLGRALIARANDVRPDRLVFVQAGMVEGERLLRRAARLGDAEAQYSLGMAQVTGLDLPLDMVHGLWHLQQAAMQGNRQALAALGLYAAKGEGFVDKSPIRAWVYDDLAGGGAPDSAATTRRNTLAEHMNAHDLARARQFAVAWRVLIPQDGE
jgi:TPR repeat protein